MKTSYNKKEIMNRAWEIRKETECTMGAAMKAAWSEAKAAAGVTPMDKTVQAYFDALANLDKWKKIVDGFQDEVKNACAENPDFCLFGFGWKASVLS